MMRRAGKSSAAFLTDTALPWASSAIVSAVNPRFFRFKRPLKLALWVALITFILTAAIGCAVYYLGCRSPQVLVPVTQITNRSQHHSFKGKCEEVYLKNFFVSPSVDSSAGDFGVLSSLFPSVLDTRVYQWTADALYQLANVTYDSPIDKALSDFNTRFEHSVMASYTLDMPVPQLPGSKSEGQSLPWQFQFFNSSNLNGTRVTPADCPVQWKAMLVSPTVALKLQGRDVFVRFNNTLDWMCTTYAWLFAEVSEQLENPQVTQGNLTLRGGASQSATFSVDNTDNSRSALMLELQESVLGSWLPPVQWCTEVFDSDGHKDSWCAAISYTGLQAEARRHLRKVSDYYAQLTKMNNEAEIALRTWTDTLQRSAAGFDLSTRDDLRKVRNSIILFMSHMSGVLSMMIASQYEREFESSLQLNTIVCRPVVCPAILGTVGSALGYMTLMEVGAAFIVLAFYLLRNDDERITMQELTQVVFEQVPEEVVQAAYKAYATQQDGESSVSRNGQKEDIRANGR